MANIVAIIVAAGTGERMKSDAGEVNLPKQYMSIAGKPMIEHSWQSFCNHPAISSVLCAIHSDHDELFAKTVTTLDKISHVYGGATRQESVLRALQHLDSLGQKPDIVLIHDAARPMISKENIDTVLTPILQNNAKAATLAVKASDTYRKGIKSHNDLLAGDFIDRANLYAIQTPQAFIYDDLLVAHQSTKNENHTDDSSIMSEAGHDVTLTPGSPFNIKVTTATDIKLVELFLKNRESLNA